MFYHENLKSYPLTFRQLSSEEIIYIIDSAGELKESARVDIKKDGFYFWGGLKFENDYIEADIKMGEEAKILIADVTFNRKIILSGEKGRITFSNGICTLSENLLFINGSIYTIPDMKKCMSLNIPDQEQCIFEMMMPVSCERYILQYSPPRGDCVVCLVDLEKKSIIKRIELPEPFSGEFKSLTDGFFLYSTKNESYELIVTIYDSSLTVCHRAVLPDDFYDTCIEQEEKCIYFWGEKEGNIWRMNYFTGEYEQIEMPGYKHSWDPLGCVNGYAFFQRSPKKVVAFRLKDGTSETISFKEEVVHAFSLNHKFYVTTALDVEKNYKTGEILRQGEVEIFLLEEEA